MDSESNNELTHGVNIEALVEFISFLKEDHEFNLGAFKFIAAQELIVSLAARNEPVHEATFLADVLRPLLCSSEREQIRFDDLFALWKDRICGNESGRPATKSPAESRPEIALEQGARRFFTDRVLILALSLIGFLGLAAWIWNRIPDVPSTSIQVVSNPAGARYEIRLDSEGDRNVAPVTIEGRTPSPGMVLPRGSYRLSLSAPDYQVLDTSFVADGDTVAVAVELVPTAPAQTRTIRLRLSAPGTESVKNTNVLLDGVPSGHWEGGEILEFHLAPGRYQVNVLHPECQSVSGVLDVEGDLLRWQGEALLSGTDLFSISLDCAIAQPVKITSDVPGVRISGENEELGTTSVGSSLLISAADIGGFIMAERAGFQTERRFPGPDGWPREIVFNLEALPVAENAAWVRPEGNRIAFSEDGSEIALEDDMGRLRVLDAESLQPVMDLAQSDRRDVHRRTSQPVHWGMPRPVLRIPRAHFWNVRALDFSTTGRWLVSAGWDGVMLSWDMEKAVQQPSLTLDPDAYSVVSPNWEGYSMRAFHGIEDMRSSVAVSVDDKVVSGDVAGYTYLSEPTASWDEDHTTPLSYSDQILSVAWHPTGRWLARGSKDGVIHLGRVSLDALNIDRSYSDLKSPGDGLQAHRGAVTGIDFHPDGSMLASTGADGLIKTWDWDDQRLRARQTFKGHSGYAETVKFRSDGRILASAGLDRAIRLWDVETGEEAARLEGHTDRVVSIAFHPLGHQLASASWDGSVRVWSLKTGQEIARLNDHEGHVWAVAWSPDGRFLASGGRDEVISIWDMTPIRDRVTPVWANVSSGIAMHPKGRYAVTATGSGALVFWDNVTRTPVDTLSAHAGQVNGLAYSEDGRRLITAAEDGEIKTWSGFTVMEHGIAIRDASFNASRTRVVSTDTLGMVRVWDARTGQLTHASYGPQPGIKSPDSLPFYTMGARFVDGSKSKLFAYGALAAHVYDLETDSLWTAPVADTLYGQGWDRTPIFDNSGRFAAISEGPDGARIIDTTQPERLVQNRLSFSGERPSVSFGPQGKLFVATSWDRFEVFDTESGLQIGDPIRRPSDCETRSKFSPDGDMVAFHMCDAVALVRRGEAQVNRTVSTPGLINDMFFDESSERLLVSWRWSEQDPGGLSLWDLTTPSPKSVFNGLRHTDGVVMSEFSPDNRGLISMGAHKLYRWDRHTGRPVWERQLTQPAAGGFSGLLSRFLLDRSGTKILVVDNQLRVKMVDALTGAITPMPVDRLDPLKTLEVTNRGLLFVDLSGFSLQLIAYESGQEDVQFVSMSDSPIEEATMSVDETIVFARFEDQKIGMWDARTGVPIGRPFVNSSFPPRSDPNGWLSWDSQGNLLSGFAAPTTVARHDAPIVSAVLSPDRKRIASVDSSNVMKLWETATGRLLDSLQVSRSVTDVVFSPDSRRVVLATTGDSVQVLQSRFSRSVTVWKWIQSGGWWIVLLGLMGSGGLHVGIRRFSLRRASQVLEKNRASGGPSVRFHAPDWTMETLFPQRVLRGIARRMRTRVLIPSDELNIGATVQASAHSGGLFVPVLDHRTEPPEYVVLVERTSLDDQQARYVDHLLDRISGQEVFISRYYFSDSPYWLIPEKAGARPIRLSDLSRQTSHKRMMIFAGAERFFNPLTGRLHSWTRLFDSWEDRTLFLPSEPDGWAYPEQELKQVFTLLPATVDGLALYRKPFAGILGGLRTGRSTGILPSILDSQSRRWVDRDRVTEAEERELLDALRSYLDPEGLRWLRACAQYPTLDWKVTLILGWALRDEAGNRLLRADRLLHMSRLPWFRYSRFPRWLGEALRTGMSPHDAKQVRAVLATLVLNSSGDIYDPLEAPLTNAEIDEAAQNADNINRMAAMLLSSRKSPDHRRHPLNQPGFHQFLTGSMARGAWKKALRAPSKSLALRRGATQYVNLLSPWNFIVAGAWLIVAAASVLVYRELPQGNQFPRLTQEWVLPTAALSTPMTQVIPDIVPDSSRVAGIVAEARAEADPREALRRFNLAIRLDPMNGAARLGRLEALVQLERWDDLRVALAGEASLGLTGMTELERISQMVDAFSEPTEFSEPSEPSGASNENKPSDS